MCVQKFVVTHWLKLSDLAHCTGASQKLLTKKRMSINARDGRAYRPPTSYKLQFFAIQFRSSNLCYFEFIFRNDCFSRSLGTVFFATGVVLIGLRLSFCYKESQVSVG